MTEKMKPAEIYRKAADVMEKKGWNNHSRFDRVKGTVCVLGALEFALGLREGKQEFSWMRGKDPIVIQLADLLKLPSHHNDTDYDPDGNGRAWALATWSNNADQSTVVKGLRDAADLLEKQEA